MRLVGLTALLLAAPSSALRLSRRAALASGATLLPLAGGAAVSAAASAAAADVAAAAGPLVDPVYPGTAVARMLAARDRVARLPAAAWSDEWDAVRRRLLWAGGLRDLRAAAPGEGYTGHSFNDFNHCDLTCMRGAVADEDNADGAVTAISTANALGAGIRAASLPELGAGGSWSTCMIGCAEQPPRDVAHVQFRSRVAFKLVWSPAEDFRSFVVVDDAGALLAAGRPASAATIAPSLEQRRQNYELVRGSKYAAAADALQLRA